MMDLTLRDLQVGQSARVLAVQAGPGMSRRLMDMGLIPGTRVTCVAKSPAGDPAAYLIRGAVIALRRRDAGGVRVDGREGHPWD
jgi:ferrous iron transport protein A